MKENSSTSIRLAAISPSLMPSAVPAEIAAIGPPPSRLSELESMAPRIPKDLRDRVRALAKGANAAMRTSPIRAAACWHEAGRLLSRRAGRHAEAWTCHSRALAIHPDYKPARDAMRRLARMAGDRETLSLIIDSQIGRPSNPCETACLLSEQAVLEIESGRHAEAMDSLRDASAAYRGAVVPSLLKLGVSVSQSDDIELAESIEALIEKWPEPETAVGLKLILALFEERLGLLDSAVSRLDGEESHVLSLAGLWARVRLRLRQDRLQEAADDLRDLACRVDDPSMRAALLRFVRALSVLSLGCEPSSTEPVTSDVSDETADLELLEALRTADAMSRSRWLGQLSKRANTASLKAALAIARDTALWAARSAPEVLSPDIGTASPAAGALAALIGADFPWEPGSTVLSAEVDPAALLYGSMAARELGQVAGDLAELRERIADREDRWALAVGEACLRLLHLEQPELALAALRGEDLEPSREPLPSLLRMVERSDEALAELSESQAETSGIPREKALYLAWAGHHRESHDRTRAHQLYERALGLDGACLLALCGLERVGARPEELARLWTSAAEAVPFSRSAAFLVRASYWHRLSGSHSRGAALLLKAHRCAADDEGLWEMAFKAASTHMRSALSSHVLEPPQSRCLRADECAAIGSLALEIAPEQAAAWFMEASRSEKDVIYLLGCEEALFEAGQAEQVISSLATALAGEHGEAAARVATRLALSCQRQGEGNDVLLRQLREIARRVPGHRPTAVKRAIVAGMSRDNTELAAALRDLANSTTDRNIAVAAAVASWQIEPSRLEAVDLASRLDETNVQAHVELEARLEGHLSDARKVALERVLAALPGSVSHWLRQAELRRGDSDDASAAQAYRQAGEVSPEDPLPMIRLVSLEGDDSRRLNALVELVGRCESPAHKRELLGCAARLASELPGLRERAGRLWADLLDEQPDDEHAFERAYAIACEIDDRELQCRVLSARLRAGLDPEARRQLHLRLVGPCLELHDRGAAKEHLSKAAELMVNDLETHMRLAQLHRDDGEWHAAIERLMTAARLVRGPEHGIPVFFGLGELYMDHSPRADLAEKSFLKVLGWNVEHVPSLERLADLYHRGGNFGRAAQALEHLVRLAATPKERIEKSLVLADVLDAEIGRPEDAERVLLQAWEADYSDLRPLEELSRLLERRFDSLSLNVFVDRAIAAHLAMPEAVCADADALGRVAHLYEMRRSISMSAIAAEARDIARGLSGRSEAARWNLGARLADPTYEEMICPKELTAALRAVLRAVEEPVAKALGVWGRQVDFGKETKLGRKEALSLNIAHVAQLFGVEPPIVYASSEPGLRLYPGSPGVLVVPRVVAESSSQALATFVAASAAHGLRHGLGLSTVVPADGLKAAFGTVLGLIAPAVAPPLPSILSSRIAEALSSKVKAQVQPFVLDVVDAMAKHDIPLLMRQAIDRAGLLGCGSLFDAMTALRLIHGQAEVGLSQLSGYGALVAFCLGKVHLDLREAMGI